MSEGDDEDIGQLVLDLEEMILALRSLERRHHLRKGREHIKIR